MEYDCKGCYTKNETSFYGNYSCYHIENEKYQRKCPCKICIVKVTCYMPCEEYEKHWHPLDKVTIRLSEDEGK